MPKRRPCCWNHRAADAQEQKLLRDATETIKLTARKRSAVCTWQKRCPIALAEDLRRPA
jgi:hypothetical protein